MAFEAKLSLLGQEYDVLYTEYELSRNVDQKGKPSSGVFGGKITIRVESTADTTKVEAMVNNQFKALDGVITFKKGDEDAKLKELEFKNAYIVHYLEKLDVSDDHPMFIEFAVSAESIIIGSAELDNNWP
ncbi:MAG: type VI secretion system tube protein TssD, partial [Bacteroidota bacterium]